MSRTEPHIDNADQTTLRGAVGLVRTVPRRMVSVEPFFMEFIAGVEDVLRPQGVSVMLAVTATLADEIETYRRWAKGGMVGAVVVVNVTADDPRPAVLAQLGMPAVFVGHPTEESQGPCVYADDASGMDAVVEHLVERGHKHIAHVTGPKELLHSIERSKVLDALAGAYQYDVTTVEGDYSDTSGEALTKELLELNPRPTAIVYHNDVMAVAGLHAIVEAGLRVPEDVALVAWDDSALCRLTQPALTTAAVDVFGMGRTSGQLLLESAQGNVQREPVVLKPRLIVRGSTM